MAHAPSTSTGIEVVDSSSDGELPSGAAQRPSTTFLLQGLASIEETLKRDNRGSNGLAAPDSKRRRTLTDCGRALLARCIAAEVKACNWSTLDDVRDRPEDAAGLSTIFPVADRIEMAMSWVGLADHVLAAAAKQGVQTLQSDPAPDCRLADNTDRLRLHVLRLLEGSALWRQHEVRRCLRGADLPPPWLQVVQAAYANQANAEAESSELLAAQRDRVAEEHDMKGCDKNVLHVAAAAAAEPQPHTASAEAAPQESLPVSMQVLEGLQLHGAAVLSLDWGPQEQGVGFRRLATALSDRKLQVWAVRIGATTQSTDGKDTECLSTMMEHLSQVTCVRWSPDGSLLASSDFEGAVLVWARGHAGGLGIRDTGPEPWHRRWLLRGHSIEVTDVAWHPGAPLSQFSLASASRDGTLRVWSVTTGQQVLSITSPGMWFLKGVSFDPLGEYIAAMGDDPRKSNSIRPFLVELRSSDRGNSGVVPAPRLVNISAQPWELAAVHATVAYNRRPSWDPLGQSLLFPYGEAQRKQASRPRHFGVLYQRGQWNSPKYFRGHAERVSLVKFCPLVFGPPGDLDSAGLSFAILSQDGMLSLWTSTLSRPILVATDLLQTDAFLHDAAWSADGEVFAYSGSNGKVCIASFTWHGTEGHPIQHSRWSLSDIHHFRRHHHVKLVEPSSDIPVSAEHWVLLVAERQEKLRGLSEEQTVRSNGHAGDTHVGCTWERTLLATGSSDAIRPAGQMPSQGHTFRELLSQWRASGGDLAGGLGSPTNGRGGRSAAVSSASTVHSELQHASEDQCATLPDGAGGYEATWRSLCRFGTLEVQVKREPDQPPLFPGAAGLPGGTTVALVRLAAAADEQLLLWQQTLSCQVVSAAASEQIVVTGSKKLGGQHAACMYFLDSRTGLQCLPTMPLKHVLREVRISSTGLSIAAVDEAMTLTQWHMLSNTTPRAVATITLPCLNNLSCFGFVLQAEVPVLSTHKHRALAVSHQMRCMLSLDCWRYRGSTLVSAATKHLPCPYDGHFHSWIWQRQQPKRPQGMEASTWTANRTPAWRATAREEIGATLSQLAHNAATMGHFGTSQEAEATVQTLLQHAFASHNGMLIAEEIRDAGTG